MDYSARAYRIYSGLRGYRGLEELGHFGAWYGDFDRSEIEKLQELERKKAEQKLDKICTLHLNHCPLYIRHTAGGTLPVKSSSSLRGKERIWW